jgi:hypothetical protein
VGVIGLSVVLLGCGSTIIIEEGAGGATGQGGEEPSSGGAGPGLLPDGASCSTEDDCASGHCVDGVCCESSCTEGCHACSEAAGSAEDGLCWLTCATNQFCEDDECVFAPEPPPPPPEAIINGSFEMGLTGWTVIDLDTPFQPLAVVPQGTPNQFMGTPTQPTDGMRSLLHGFDGEGPGEISVSQTFTVPTGTTGVRFDYRAGWDNLGMLARTFEVAIEDPNGAVLEVVPILVAQPMTNIFDTGSQTASVSLTDFLGQAIRLRLAWYIPEPFTGPAFFELDHVRLY